MAYKALSKLESIFLSGKTPHESAVEIYALYENLPDWERTRFKKSLDMFDTSLMLKEARLAPREHSLENIKKMKIVLGILRDEYRMFEE